MKSSDECYIGEYEGFMKYRCPPDILGDFIRLEKYKCHNTEDYYYWESYYQKIRGEKCSKDTHYYQACEKRLPGYKVSNGEILCDNWLCQSADYPKIIYSLISLKQGDDFCDGHQHCVDDKDETNCQPEETTKLPSGEEVKSRLICNDKCDAASCEDEAHCNGLSYGVYCEHYPDSYVRPSEICNNYPTCPDGTDEEVCQLTEETKDTCIQYDSEERVPVLNFTRCGVLDEAHGYNKYCADKDLKKYQTNCTDPARVGATCFVDGYLSTVSKYAICYIRSVTVCDDNIESQCPEISKSCLNIHKHALCDKVADCDDESDELHPSCRKLTVDTCIRRVGNAGAIPLPLTWLGDGIQDCADGSDEMKIWPTCGEQRTRRYVTSNDTCENVFLCRWGNPGFVESKDLCDGVETCGNENKICSISRRSKSFSTSVLGSGFMKQLSVCLKGLRSIQTLGNPCSKTLFIFPNHRYFGVDNKTELYLPERIQDCDNMYGEQYVFTSCTNRCRNAACPLENPPRYEVCPNQYPNRIGTIANDEYLVFFTKSHGNL